MYLCPYIDTRRQLASSKRVMVCRVLATPYRLRPLTVSLQKEAKPLQTSVPYNTTTYMIVHSYLEEVRGGGDKHVGSIYTLRSLAHMLVVPSTLSMATVCMHYYVCTA